VALLCNHCCSGRAVSITYCECVCVCVCVCVCSLTYSTYNAHASYYLPSVACTGLQQVSTLPDKWHDFQNKKLLNTKYAFLFPLHLLYETFLILSRNEQSVIENIHWSSHKVPLFLTDFNKTLILSKDFWKIFKYQI
jgi:hypothetical protein